MHSDRAIVSASASKLERKNFSTNLSSGNSSTERQELTALLSESEDIMMRRAEAMAASMSRISPALRRRVRERARSYCEYCRSFMDYTGHEFTVDHIIPESQGGTNDFDNLCFCCFWCNNYKRAQTEFRDPLTGRDVRLFNPRKKTGKPTFDGAAHPRV